jgi:hypothetical protein
LSTTPHAAARSKNGYAWRKEVGMIGIPRNAGGGYTGGSLRSFFQVTPDAVRCPHRIFKLEGETLGGAHAAFRGKRAAEHEWL